MSTAVLVDAGGRRRPRLAVHAAIYGIAVLLVVSITGPTRTFTPDEGVYGLQVKALEAGSWRYSPPAASFDPDGQFFLAANALGDGPARVLYGRHPAYVLLLRALAPLGNGLALLAPGIASAVVAAVTAWCLARRLAPGREVLAFWIAAASPLTFNAAVLWGHNLAAAAGGLGVLGLLRAIDRPVDWRRWSIVIGAAVVGALVRSEGQVMGLALALGAIGMSIHLRRRAIAWGGVTTLAVVAAVTFVERRWSDAIGWTDPESVRPRGDGSGIGGFLRDRISAARWSVFAPSFYGGAEDRLLIAAVLIVAVWAVARRTGVLWTGAALAAVALYAARIVADPLDPAVGLVAGWPVAIVALGAAVRTARVSIAGRIVVAIVGVFVLAVIATEYPDGGALQWGGRFFAPAVPLLALFAAAAHPSGSWRSWRLVVGSLAVVPVVASLVCLGSLRAQHERAVETVLSVPTDVQLALPTFLPLAGWRHDEAVWLQVRPPEVQEALDVVRRHGARTATLVWLDQFPVSTEGWEVVTTDSVRYDVFDLRIYRLARSSGPELSLARDLLASEVDDDG